ncbi:MAG: MarR family winged helix-turn-helix transcriptional regulator [Hyphomicrobiaceae bacterium]
MTDITLPASSRKPARGGTPALRPDEEPDTDRLVRLVELLFFAYRDFTSDPDQMLSAIGFGRAHHRVLHFVARNPGLCVADLLSILTITKQSLARVLKQLVDEGYILQQRNEQDRRERLLFPTEKGRSLATSLARPQLERISRALAAAGPGGELHAERFLFSMLNADEQVQVARIVRRQVGARQGPEDGA